MSQAGGPGAYLGRPLARVEDADLLCGRGRFSDDLPVRTGTLHAAILRSPHAHAELLSVDAEAASAILGVVTVVTGDDAKRWTRPFTAAVKAPVEHWCLAVDGVRYVGEPVAVVLARDRYTAADALELIEVSYRPLPAVIDPVAATGSAAPLLHPALGCNVISDRSFRYGDPETAFASAAHRITVTTTYPRNSGSPIEGFVVIAEYLPGEGVYEVTANFQGPLAMHPVMAMALDVPANRLRLKTPPDSGGSFGVKHAVFPYIVLMAIAARKAGPAPAPS
jgi:2-furoyl-CoA dehydrogenase large subunit